MQDAADGSCPDYDNSYLFIFFQKSQITLLNIHMVFYVTRIPNDTRKNIYLSY